MLTTPVSCAQVEKVLCPVEQDKEAPDIKITVSFSWKIGQK